MEPDKSCRLCLGDHSVHNQTEPESDELRGKVDKIFYFRVVRNPNDTPIWICGGCVATVDAFYEYAQSVFLNQELIRSKVVDGCADDEEPEFLVINVKEEEDAPDHSDVFEIMLNDSLGADEEGLVTGSADEMEALCDTSEATAPKQEKLGDEEQSEGECPPKKIAGKRRKREPVEKKTTDYQQSKLEKEMLQHFSLSCDLCSKPLGSLKELKRHFKVTHQQESYIVCCGKKIVRNFMILQHFQLHLDPHAFRCNLCNKDYSTIKVLKTHINEVHTTRDARSIECEVCHKTFVTRRHLNAHLSVSHGSVPCPQCPKRLASTLSLSKHLLAMHGEGEQHVCDICARVFRTKRCLDTHVKTHLGTRIEERVQCSKCSAWFMDQNCLNRHLKRVHEVFEREIECEICGWRGRNKVAMYNHTRMSHTEVRHQCEYCSKKFRRVQHMREHIAIHHTGADLYNCNYCSERFNSKNKLYTHRKTVHPNEYEDEIRKWQMKDPTFVGQE